MERDNWTCKYCGTTEHTLHVHHFSYSGEPWEAPDEKLTTLCEDCHWMHEQPQFVVDRLQAIFRRAMDNGQSPTYCRRDLLTIAGAQKELRHG